MKKQFLIILILATLLLSSSCQNSNSLQRTESSENSKKENVSEEAVGKVNNGFAEICGYQVFVHHTKEYPIKFDEYVGAYEGDVVPNEEAAVCITKQIFDSIDKPSAYDGFEPVILTYDEGNLIWIVTFNRPGAISEDSITIGNSFSIAIQQKDGKVLRMWAGE